MVYEGYSKNAVLMGCRSLESISLSLTVVYKANPFGISWHQELSRSDIYI